MEFVKKFAIWCVAALAALGAIDANVRDGEACLVNYLQKKEKLNSDFPIGVPVLLQCRLVVPLTMQVLKTQISEQINKEAPNNADCLTEEFSDQEAVDYVLKISVLDSSTLVGESDRQTQLEATRNDFRNDLEKIASRCGITDPQSFVNLFNDHLGVKNQSLTVLQHDYCLAKYVVDNGALILGNVEMNPQHIDPKGVDCDGIIDADKRKSEKDLTDRTAAKVKGQRQVNCITDAYKDSKMYDVNAALRVLNKLNFSRNAKEVETNRLSQKIAEFAITVMTCNM